MTHVIYVAPLPKMLNLNLITRKHTPTLKYILQNNKNAKVIKGKKKKKKKLETVPG